MGLYMYLNASKYISGYDFNPADEQKQFKAILKQTGLTSKDISDSTPGMHVEITAVYWRKVNAVHGWFVKNVQDGKDECQRSYVGREQLEELVKTCKKALKASDPSKVLAPCSGFFFGSSEVDEYYKADLKYTIEKVEAVLKNPKFESWDFYYQASW